MIKIIGPRDKKEPRTINTTSHSPVDWSRGLSPFVLGPIELYGSHTARIFENAWQFAKLYPEHADTNGQPTSKYWTWAQNGWKSTTAFRYPAGKGSKPLCSLWNGNRLQYIEARKQIYIPLYQHAVKRTTAYQTLERLYVEQRQLTLFDFDGYDHHQLGMSFKDVINCPTHVWARFYDRSAAKCRPNRTNSHSKTSLVPNNGRQPQKLPGRKRIYRQDCARPPRISAR